MNMVMDIATEVVVMDFGEKLFQGNPQDAAKDQKVIDALKTVYDPELPVDVYQLGLIYDIKVTEEGHCFVLHTLTSAFCPAADKIPKDIQMAIESIPGIKKCHTRITMVPPWTQESIEPSVRQLLFGY